MNSHIKLIGLIAHVGRANPSMPVLEEISAFKYFFNDDHQLIYEKLDEEDGSCTRRELLLRFLLLSAVIDQGPDVVGIRKLLIDVTNTLYRQEVRFLHAPIAFFQHVGFTVDTILDKHSAIKEIRSEIWARENESNPNRYNLFMDNSKQVLNFAIFRWGVPLSAPMLLEHDNREKSDTSNLLVNYLEQYASAEIMSDELKSHERYGLGKAIGNKASHLFAKWMVSSFKLSRREGCGWDDYSYEVPYDSNAGRVLWRTGYLLDWTSKDEYLKKSVIQPRRGKGGKNYLRVTNIRGMKSSKTIDPYYKSLYDDLCLNRLKSHKREPRTLEIQRLQHIFLMENPEKYSVANFDDGLLHIGTNFCFNHSKPLCLQCPIKDLCQGFNADSSLIEDYRT